MRDERAVTGADLGAKYDVNPIILHIVREIGRGGIIDLDQSGIYGVWLIFMPARREGEQSAPKIRPLEVSAAEQELLCRPQAIEIGYESRDLVSGQC